MRGGAGTIGMAAMAWALACAAAAVLAPSAAMGRDANAFTPFASGTQIEFSLGKAPGRKLSVSTRGQRVTLTVSRGPQSVSYEAAAAVSADGLRADLGRAGTIDVRFRPSGPPQAVEPFPFCKGKEGSNTAGVFVGTVRFAGFDRFVHFHARRVRGEVTRTPPMHCHFPGGPQKHQPAGEAGEEGDTTLVLSAARPCAGPVFLALTDAKALTHFSLFAAISTEQVGHVRVSRFAIVPSSAQRRFAFDPGLTSAEVSPPAPFHGSAAFQRGAEGAAPTWSGSLRIDFLDGSQGLTGDGFEPALEEVAAGDGSLVESKCDSGHAQRSSLSIP